jgi:hypothetical protein
MGETHGDDPKASRPHRGRTINAIHQFNSSPELSIPIGVLSPDCYIETMTIVRFLIVLTAMFSASLAVADDLVLDGSPYSPIVTRNVFGLQPIPTVDPNAAAAADVPPPPKITPNGIMTIFGSKEALYKVAGVGKPGQPPQDQSYELGEGESQDDIEVVKIDDQADVITFNNHGTIQELPLSAAPDLSTPSGPSGGPGFPVPRPGFRRFPRPGMPGGPMAAPQMQNSAFNPNNNNNTDPNNASAGASGGTSPFSASDNISPENQGLSPEAQALLIENNYIKAKEANDPTAPLFPPTPLRGQSDGSLGGDGSGGGGPALPNP